MIYFYCARCGGFKGMHAGLPCLNPKCPCSPKRTP